MKQSGKPQRSFQWADFYDLAEQWHNSQNTASDCVEARLRCIISRAYYGVWNSCREFAELKASTRPIPASGNAHDNIVQWFYAGETSAHKEVAANLHRLKKSRVIADYKTNWGRTTPQEAATNALFVANRILNGLSGLEN